MKVIIRANDRLAIRLASCILTLIGIAILLAAISMPATPQIITIGTTTWGPPRDLVVYYRIWWIMNDETGGSRRIAGYEAAVSEMAAVMVLPGVVDVGVERE